MTGLIFPLAILGALAAFLGGMGIEHAWIPRDIAEPIRYLSYAISAALHLAWILPASRRRCPLVVVSAWTVSVHFCQAGIEVAARGDGFVYSVLVEGIPLLVALSLVPRDTWAERLARWRRSRSEIGIQLRMGEGLLSWLPPAFRQFLVGPAALPPGGDYRRFVAELQDAEHRLQVHLAGAVLPERLRQTIHSCAAELVGQAETSAARIGFELEQMALTAAASCHEQLDVLDLPAAEKDAFARQCQSFFVGLIEPARRVLTGNLVPAAKTIKEEEAYEPTR